MQRIRTEYQYNSVSGFPLEDIIFNPDYDQQPNVSVNTH